jgi:hypothetical protein
MTHGVLGKCRRSLMSQRVVRLELFGDLGDRADTVPPIVLAEKWGLVTSNPVPRSEPPVPKKHRGIALTPAQ